MGENTTVDSDERMLNIIEALKERTSAGVTELADALEMPKSTVHVHLSTLKERGYVVQDESHEYRLSLRFLDMGTTIRQTQDMYDEVVPKLKQLAEEVQEAATEVEAQLKTVQSQTTTAVTAAESAVDDADDAAATVEEAGERFDQVTEYAGDTSSGVTEISHATDDQAASTEETVSIVEDALETSKQTVEYADRLATASEEQAHLMDEISADSDSLTTRAQELQDLLTQFTTGSDSGHRSEVEGSASPRPTAMGDGGSG